jgi:hypothetical protein
MENITPAKRALAVLDAPGRPNLCPSSGRHPAIGRRADRD